MLLYFVLQFPSSHPLGSFPLREALMLGRHHALALLLQSPFILVDQYDDKTGNTCLLGMLFFNE
jgi:hypothetical protein